MVDNIIYGSTVLVIANYLLCVHQMPLLELMSFLTEFDGTVGWLGSHNNVHFSVRMI